MARRSAQARVRPIGSDFPHRGPGDTVQVPGSAKEELVRRLAPSYRVPRGNARKDGISQARQRLGLVAHRLGITCIAVDGVGTAMYESNQRSNKHNRKL